MMMMMVLVLVPIDYGIPWNGVDSELMMLHQVVDYLVAFLLDYSDNDNHDMGRRRRPRRRRHHHHHHHHPLPVEGIVVR